MGLVVGLHLGVRPAAGDARHLVDAESGARGAPEAGIWVSVGSIVLTLLLVSFQGFVIRKTNSVAIKADMLHYRSDLLFNGGVLVALVLAGQGGTGPTACLHSLDGLFPVWGLSISATNRCRPC